VRGQILDAFSTRAKAIGIRAVMMGELAAELRISASTLYKHFASKEALTLACVERWALELAAMEASEASAAGKASAAQPASGADGFARFMRWVDAWADANGALSPAFSRDLKSDYPAAWKRFLDVVDERKRRGAEILRPMLKPELDERVALAILNLILTTVLNPEFAARLRISRHEAIHSAVSIWAGGAVDRRGTVRALRAPKRERSAPRGGVEP